LQKHSKSHFFKKLTKYTLQYTEIFENAVETKTPTSWMPLR